jgi:membrane fusion protein (multidrug efflux system)
MEETQAKQTQPTTKGLRKITSWLIGILILSAAIAGGIWYWHALRVTISTDNAQVAGNIVVISPKVSGRLVKLYVKEGDTVTAGEEMAELDHSSLLAALNQAKAALGLTQANYDQLPYSIRSAQATVDKDQQELQASRDQVNKDQSSLSNAQQDLDQASTLYSSGAASKDTLDADQMAYQQAQATMGSDAANVLAAQATVADDQAQLDEVDNTGAEIYHAQLKQAQAAYDSAKLSYEESFIYAPVSGTVVQVPAIVGETMLGEDVSQEQEILSICDLQTTWVVANIDEGKFGRLRLGQRVDVRVDAYPGHVFSGKIIELGKATQATFSLIPAQNDSGNYTKVSQLLPVKIEIANKDGLILDPGMSVEVTIHTA